MAFFPDNGPAQVRNQKIYVGSIKTVIGHLEGTAGLASLLKASQAVKHGLIPPNLHFNHLNPDIEPFYHQKLANMQMINIEADACISFPDLIAPNGCSNISLEHVQWKEVATFFRFKISGETGALCRNQASK